jgi:methylamine---glutamate N-methyltransferase subunit A
MCGIVGYLDKRVRRAVPSGRLILMMLEALACRGPDSAGVALLHDLPEPGPEADAWTVRIAPAAGSEPTPDLSALAELGRVEARQQHADSHRIRFHPAPGVTAGDVETTLGARRGGLEVLSMGTQLALVKQVGSPSELEEAYRVSAWCGPLAIGHTRMSTESRIDLSHSQPFWAHGALDLATVHNGHVTNYHRLRRHYEQKGVTFYTDNDSEVIGVYLRDRLEQGRTLPEALGDSLADLDGAYNYLVAAPEGLGIVRDRFGFKPLVIAETDTFVAVATEEIALRRALPGTYRVAEPAIGVALFYPLPALELAGGVA